MRPRKRIDGSSISAGPINSIAAAPAISPLARGARARKNARVPIPERSRVGVCRCVRAAGLFALALAFGGCSTRAETTAERLRAVAADNCAKGNQEACSTVIQPRGEFKRESDTCDALKNM